MAAPAAAKSAYADSRSPGLSLRRQASRPAGLTRERSEKRAYSARSGSSLKGHPGAASAASSLAARPPVFGRTPSVPRLAAGRRIRYSTVCRGVTRIACGASNPQALLVSAAFGRGQAVRQRTLDPPSQVRILAPEPASTRASRTPRASDALRMSMRKRAWRTRSNLPLYETCWGHHPRGG